jgi:hypothetical protein
MMIYDCQILYQVRTPGRKSKALLWFPLGLGQSPRPSLQPCHLPLSLSYASHILASSGPWRLAGPSLTGPFHMLFFCLEYSPHMLYLTTPDQASGVFFCTFPERPCLTSPTLGSQHYLSWGSLLYSLTSPVFFFHSV